MDQDLLKLRKIMMANRIQQNRILDAEIEQEQSSAQYKGFDPSSGQGIIQDIQGNTFYGISQTNGAIGLGDAVLRREGNIARYDAMPTRNRKQATEIKIISSLKGFIVWNTGYTIYGYADKSVDFFSGITDRDRPEWKKCVSHNSTLMPDIKDKKLFYIPMVGRDLTDDEKLRLKAFQQAGGWTFATGEYGSFHLEKRKANQVMELLNSPLRCIDSNSIYGASFQGGNYPCTFNGIPTLYGNASCEVSGGISISIIPESTFTLPFTGAFNIKWMAYDKKSKTILSGDVDWAGQVTPDNTNNAKFAKALLKL